MQTFNGVRHLTLLLCVCDVPMTKLSKAGVGAERGHLTTNHHQRDITVQSPSPAATRRLRPTRLTAPRHHPAALHHCQRRQPLRLRSIAAHPQPHEGGGRWRLRGAGCLLRAHQASASGRSASLDRIVESESLPTASGSAYCSSGSTGTAPGMPRTIRGTSIPPRLRMRRSHTGPGRPVGPPPPETAARAAACR